ncbi:cell division protein FtsX [Novosphingobium sp.]|uniref:cell division protein FtsX n=1 Tax=Novosphingobium sp. TaxID=1874826 RepID=UPI003B520210
MNASALFGSLKGSPGDDSALLPDPRMGSPMPWVIAIVIALTVIAAASGLALRNAAARADADLVGGVTVQIVSAAPADRNRQADAALAVLQHAPGVIEARHVAQTELDALLEPWLGTRPGDTIDDLPIPALIDLRLDSPATPARVDSLRAQIASVAPAARVDAQSGWLTPVFRAIGTLQWLAGGLIALLALATIAAVVLSARNALVTHRQTIEIVHMLGGTDPQIARVFQRTAAMDAAIGGMVGLFTGAIAIVILGRQFSALGSGMVAGAALGLTDWLLIVLIPLAGVALAVLTARLTVLSALRRML